MKPSDSSAFLIGLPLLSVSPREIGLFRLAWSLGGLFDEVNFLMELSTI